MIRSLLFWLIVGLLYWFDSTHPTIAGPYAGAFLGALFTAIGAVFGWIADKAVDIAIIIYHATVIVGRALWDVAVRVAGVFRDVYGFLQKFWSNVLRPFVQWVWREIDRLAGFLKRTLKPVLDFLLRVRRELLKIYERFVRPVLDTIGVIRRTLQLLALLRFEWAKDLDRHLAELEDRLMQPIRLALGKINEVINIVNSVASGFGLLQRVALIRSLWRDQAYAWRVLVNSRTRAVTDAQREEVRRLQGTRTYDDVTRDLDELVTTGGGNYGPGAAEIIAMLEVSMRAR